MNDKNPTNLPSASSPLRILDAIAREHLPEDLNLLPRVMAQVEAAHQRKTKMNNRLKFAATSLVVLILLGVALFSIPSVAEAFQRLLGYIPGSGLVDNSRPIRVLATPTSQTRDGVTITVNKAILTAERTQIEFSVFGVPAEAYPKAEDIQGCYQRPYLLLEDGTQVTEADPLPAAVDHATFIIPCIANTSPGKAPENWRFELRFMPAPPDLTVMPVIDVPPTASPVVEATSQTPAEVRAAVEKFVETPDGYILIGTFRPQVAEGTWVEVTDMPQITDAAGQLVRYDLVPDMELPEIENGNPGSGEFSWAYQVKDAGLAYPLTLSFSGVYISAAQPAESVEFEFDAGQAPQAGQEWELNRDFQLSGYSLHLLSISCTGDGYSLVFGTGQNGAIASVNVDIVGQTPVGGGGGYGGDTFNTGLAFKQLPTGKLTVRLSNLMARSAPHTWQAQWQPTTPHTLPTLTPATAQSAACALSEVPAEISGRLMIYDPKQQLVRVSDFGAQQPDFTLPNAANRAVFSPDGLSIAYADDTAMHILDASSGQPMRSINYALGYNIAWSPDGSSLAYVAGGAGIYLVDNQEGALPRRVSDQANEALAGWSADSAYLYITQPDLSSGSWLLRKVNVQSGAAENVFVLSDASRKAPFAALSPDGNWLAYRNAQLNTVLLAELPGDGLSPRTLVELSGSPNYTTVGSLAWSGEWLAVNLLGSQEQFAVLLVNPATCQAYRLDGVGGYLLGVVLER